VGKIRVKNNLRKVGCEDVSKNGLPQDRIQLRACVATRIDLMFHNNRGFAEFLFRENSAQWRQAEIHACW